jgi:hypothetical protein
VGWRGFKDDWFEWRWVKTASRELLISAVLALLRTRGARALRPANNNPISVFLFVGVLLI